MVALVRFVVGSAVGGGLGVLLAVQVLARVWGEADVAGMWRTSAIVVAAGAALGGVVAVVWSWREDRRPLLGHELGRGARDGWDLLARILRVFD